MIIASKTRHTGIVKLLLECGANVDHRNSHGWTALLKASEKGDSKLEIIELLLKYGAQVDQQNDAGESALMVAAQNDRAKLATKLVREYGASVGLTQKHCSWTALMEASERGVFIQRNGTMEWNGGMERWNGMEWNGIVE